MQGQQRPVLIYYYIPEDKDEADIPNAFPVLKPGGQIQLRDIRAKFPLPGKYHFRFKMRLGDTVSALWMDVTNEDSQVPMFDGRIVAKVTRLSWGLAASSSVPAQSPPAAPVAEAHAELLGFDGHTPSPVAAAAGGGAQPRAAWPAQGANSQPPPPPAAPQVQAKNNDFDMLFS
mmetsp:Transcript_109749/g.291519  ORF Transcript_109749/g.291519 Transcript_109749/m.291519 type:complete len:174 (-) Transcript_109749:81-602(-)|eukprot:CAMPEP_0171216362 /NCGR_PEP_ID=MMETSP0790-20130122/32142_1 /TAXON_ID=2925 /ORGANISM="Alexandrium catenella, Strain OF101" /LENGTH=173 /DNA_ID=CAMNT_0011682141 /DNA_START=104 /DNA_END=625 /DNA_ORIENTATION=+